VITNQRYKLVKHGASCRFLPMHMKSGILSVKYNEKAQCLTVRKRWIRTCCQSDSITGWCPARTAACAETHVIYNITFPIGKSDGAVCQPYGCVSGRSLLASQRELLDTSPYCETAFSTFQLTYPRSRQSNRERILNYGYREEFGWQGEYGRMCGGDPNVKPKSRFLY